MASFPDDQVATAPGHGCRQPLHQSVCVYQSRARRNTTYSRCGSYAPVPAVATESFSASCRRRCRDEWQGTCRSPAQAHVARSAKAQGASGPRQLNDNMAQSRQKVAGTATPDPNCFEGHPCPSKCPARSQCDEHAWSNKVRNTFCVVVIRFVLSLRTQALCQSTLNHLRPKPSLPGKSRRPRFGSQQ